MPAEGQKRYDVRIISYSSLFKDALQLHFHAACICAVAFKSVFSLARGLNSCRVYAPGSEPLLHRLGAQAGNGKVDLVAAVAVAPAFEAELQRAVGAEGIENFKEFAAFRGAEVPFVEGEMDALAVCKWLSWSECGESCGFVF